MAHADSDPAGHALVLVCSSCQARLRVPQVSRAKTLRCPRCREVLPAPCEPAEGQLLPLSPTPRPADVDDEDDAGEPTYVAQEPKTNRPIEIAQPDRF
jgi:hypothetical protein